MTALLFLNYDFNAGKQVESTDADITCGLCSKKVPERISGVAVHLQSTYGAV
ncbi:MAG: hypothetical protein IIA09_18840 [Proteobacteria bacterium]|nr:hypothetical protein [Pseudomonadota bacterium]